MNYVSPLNINPVNNLILASASQAYIARWREGLHGFANLFDIDRLILLRDEMVRLKPDVLLLDRDLPGLDGVRGVFSLRKLCPDTKIVMLRSSGSDEEEWTMFRAGVRGCCSADIAPSSLKTLVGSVQNGELWIRRRLAHRLLEQLKDTQSREDGIIQSSLRLLEKLTQREYEIAVRVSRGDSNKQIANSLDITERTVKAHLTEIFRKLEVTDRLKVAVILSEERRQVRRIAKGKPAK